MIEKDLKRVFLQYYVPGKTPGVYVPRASVTPNPWYFPFDSEPMTERQPERRSLIPETPPEYWTQPYPQPARWTWTGDERKDIRGYDY